MPSESFYPTKKAPECPSGRGSVGMWAGFTPEILPVCW
jgi:hypothetical protein